MQTYLHRFDKPKFAFMVFTYVTMLRFWKYGVTWRVKSLGDDIPRGCEKNPPEYPVEYYEEYLLF